MAFRRLWVIDTGGLLPAAPAIWRGRQYRRWPADGQLGPVARTQLPVLAQPLDGLRPAMRETRHRDALCPGRCRRRAGWVGVARGPRAWPGRWPTGLER